MTHRLRWLVAIIPLAIATACTDFAPLDHGVCGNGVIEPGEDCDSDDATCVRCARVCTAVTDCPSGDYACGVDGFCHAPGGSLGPSSVPVPFQVDDVVITDVNHDGVGDAVGLSKTSLVVRFGDGNGALLSAQSFVTPVQSGPAAFGDLDGDGTIDVTLSTEDGLVSFTSQFGTLSPVDIEQPIRTDTGAPLDIETMFAFGPQQLALFVDDPSKVVLLAAVDLLAPNKPVFVAPCGARLGAITHQHLALSSIDTYQVNAAGALTRDFVVSFLTDTGALCVNAIHGSTLGGYTITDITPAGATALAKKPILADLDTDADACPGLVNSDGGLAALRLWDGAMSGGHCTLAAAGPTGAQLPAPPNAPANAVAIGHIPLVPAIPTIASDAIVMTSGVYVFSPGSNAMAAAYETSRTLAHVAIGDLDKDGDIDAVLATANEDDLDVLYRFPLGLELLRLDTASQVTSVTIGDFDGNGINDIAYTETSTNHQNMMVAYGTPDRPLDPVQVATFSGIGAVAVIQFPDSVDRLSIADDMFVMQPGAGGGSPTSTLLHGSPQRTMLSFFDPRADGVRQLTLPRGAVVGDFVDSVAHHEDLLAVATPRPNAAVGLLAFKVPGAEAGLDPTPTAGMTTSGLADCPAGSGLCVDDAAYLAFPQQTKHDIVIAVDRSDPPRASMLDPWAAGGLGSTAISALTANLPSGAVVRSLHRADTDGDGALDLVASFATKPGFAPGGSVRVCKMSNGMPQTCTELAPIVKERAANIAACVDAAPGVVALRGPTVAATSAATDLVVLCNDGGEGSTLFRVFHDADGYHATALAQASGLRSVIVGDVTGDGVDDVVAIQGDTGARSLVVFPQCTSRNPDGCRAASSSSEGSGK